MIKCICVNDANMPKDFPNPAKWVKAKQEYHVHNILFIVRSGVLGVQLEEIDLTDCKPYLFFSIERFAFREEDMGLIQALIEQSKDIHEDDQSDVLEKIKKLLSEEEFAEV